MRNLRLARALAIVCAIAGLGSPQEAAAQAVAAACPPAGWTPDRLNALKTEKFAIADASRRQSLALALTACLGDPNPVLRDGIAFGALSAWMRAGLLDRMTLGELRNRLMPMLANPDAQGFRATILSPEPFDSWNAAFASEAGLAKRHNTRAFLLSVYAGASTSENAGVRQLLGPVRDGLKTLP